MNSILGWMMALGAVVLGGWQWGWQGVVLAVTCIVFWLLLQFNRAVRVMRMAAARPVGTVDSAVMLHSKLHPGMRMLEVLPLTRSLGKALEEEHEVFEWGDESGARVRVEMHGGRISRLSLLRDWTGDSS
jgi:hypothetical protein